MFVHRSFSMQTITLILTSTRFISAGCGAFEKYDITRKVDITDVYRRIMVLAFVNLFVYENA